MQRLRALRASNGFIISTLIIAGFVHNYASLFVVPIYPYILHHRLSMPVNEIQTSISIILALFGLTMSFLSPFMGVIVDRFASRKAPLIVGLLAQLACVLLTAWAPMLAVLYFGSILQGIAGALLNITTLSTIADIAGSSNIGKIMGISSPLMKAGSLLGPMTGGILVSTIGYWRAWTIPVAVILIDLFMRLAMIDKSENPRSDVSSERIYAEEDSGIETPLLKERRPSSSSSEPSGPVAQMSQKDYFFCLLQKRRIISSISLTIIFSIACGSFNATLPLHAETTFGWGPRNVGFLFFALVGPSIILSPFAGWLRDRIGVRLPAMAGTFLSIPSFVLIGLAGDGGISRLQGDCGKGVLISALLLIGIAIELTAGTAIIEGSSGFIQAAVEVMNGIANFCTTKVVIDELNACNPGIYGPNGGYSRFFSLTTMLVPVGWLVGPLLSGALNIRFGYVVMNAAMAGLALICFFIAALWVGERQVPIHGSDSAVVGFGG